MRLILVHGEAIVAVNPTPFEHLAQGLGAKTNTFRLQSADVDGGDLERRSGRRQQGGDGMEGLGVGQLERRRSDSHGRRLNPSLTAYDVSDRHYNETATPFNWRFTTDDLIAMLERVVTSNSQAAGLAGRALGGPGQVRTVKRWHARVPMASMTHASCRPVMGGHQPPSTGAVFTVNEYGGKPPIAFRASSCASERDGSST